MRKTSINQLIDSSLYDVVRELPLPVGVTDNITKFVGGKRISISRKKSKRRSSRNFE